MHIFLHCTFSLLNAFKVKRMPMSSTNMKLFQISRILNVTTNPGENYCIIEIVYWVRLYPTSRLLDFRENVFFVRILL